MCLISHFSNSLKIIISKNEVIPVQHMLLTKSQVQSNLYSIVIFGA
jgi:hypothetical protein